MNEEFAGVTMLEVYLASPLGFSPQLKPYRDKIKRRLYELGCAVLAPWLQPLRSEIQEANSLSEWHDRVKKFRKIAREIGKANERIIRSCDLTLGVLDVAQLDSGTIAEIGFAAALGKKCYGLRTDFRNRGDFDGIPINLQVLYWIESTVGELFRRRTPRLCMRGTLRRTVHSQ